MTITKFKKASLLLILILVLSVAADAAPKTPKDADYPKTRRELVQDNVTQLVIDILPGRGVKVIFPWVLDRESSELPFKSWLISDAVFEQETPESQNYIIYRIKAIDPGIEGEVTDAFINAQGFHFNFTLRANFNRRDHYSTVIFDLSDAKKLELIERAVQRRQIALAREFSKKEQELDERAKRLSLKLVARTVMGKSKSKGIYETGKLKLSSGDKIIFRAGKLTSHGDIHILKIEVENDSKLEPVYINGIALEKTSGDKSPLMSEFELPKKVGLDETVEGFVVTQDSRVLNGDDSKMTLFTDKGNVELLW